MLQAFSWAKACKKVNRNVMYLLVGWAANISCVAHARGPLLRDNYRQTVINTFGP